MSIYYEIAEASYHLILGFTPAFVGRRVGITLDESYYLDIERRIELAMDIDREMYRRFSDIGLGFANPVPRASIEPFGHRFVPAMFGCECSISPDGEPWARTRPLDDEAEWPPWTRERFEASEPVARINEQTAVVRERFGHTKPPVSHVWNPHYTPLCCVQNLGSVINGAVSIYGDDILSCYAADTNMLIRLYRNITDLMLHSLEYFSSVTPTSPRGVFIGNCTVPMISPSSYGSVNLGFDREIAEFAARRGERFLLHQDSGATPYLASYGGFGRIDAFDIGSDTDFDELFAGFGPVPVTCILLPAWIASSSAEEIAGELKRLMKIGDRFDEFAFAVYDVGPELDDEALCRFVELFRRVSSAISGDRA